MIPSDAVYIVEEICQAGFEAYYVGGCVRDVLLGKKPKDWDICTSAKPEDIIRIFGNKNTYPTGIKHGTITVIPFDGADGYEVTTYRVDGKYSDGRHPDEIKFASNLIEDLSRRDFTMNALACGTNGEITDLFGGKEDLQKGIIRCVGDPCQRFEEDSLRILRAMRFASRYGFAIERDTAEAMRAVKSRMSLLSRERIGKEVLGIITGRYAAKTISAYRDILFSVVPELKAMDGCRQNNPYHYGTVLEHTLDALEYANTSTIFPSSWADDYTKIAILLHDIGKPEVKTTGNDNCDHFYRHADRSARIAERVLTYLRCSKNMRETVVELVKNHAMDCAPSKQNSKRLLNRFGEEQLHRLFKIAECDVLAHTGKAKKKLENIVQLKEYVESVLAEESVFSVRQLAVNGNDLIALGMLPGPEIGDVLNQLLDEVIGGAENDKEKLLEKVVSVRRNSSCHPPKNKYA